MVGPDQLHGFEDRLTTDIYPFFTQNWFPGPPWKHAEHYLRRSPISQVGRVKTPTMILTGEAAQGAQTQVIVHETYEDLAAGELESTSLSSRGQLFAAPGTPPTEVVL